jgi:metacaspase-1
MRKRAFCVGINDYRVRGQDLKGCVNDARAWRDLLVRHFDFPASDVSVLTDRDATKRGVIAGLKSLLARARSGDVLVFTNSSHGSQIADVGADEDAYDEVLCPHDTNVNVVSDDELRELLGSLAEGVRMTVISDSCHSGTVTRTLLNELLPPELRFPDNRRVRFLNPALFRSGKILPNPMKAKPKRRIAYPESGMNHLLLSGCKDSEYSYDAKLNGKYYGAMTFHAIAAIRDAGYTITPSALVREVRLQLAEAGFPQHPQLEGPAAAKRRQLFT